MIKGKIALGGLSLEFGGAQKRFDELSAKVKELAAHQEKLWEEERRILEELARIYLPELTPETASAGLRELQSGLQQALVEHRRHASAVGERLEAAEKRVADLQAEVQARVDSETEAADDLARVAEAVEATLGEDQGHRDMAAEHDAIMERRAALKYRRARLQSTSNVERANYEAFKPFAYLRNRRFGEPEYHAAFLTRALDRWLARRIEYDVLAERYRVLRIGPHAIQAEIRRLTDRATELEAELDRRQESAGARHGLIAALEADAEAQRRVVEARQGVHDATVKRDRIAAELRAVEANRGGRYEDAISMHEQFLQSRSVRELEELARATPDRRDDELVAKLDAVRARLNDSGRDLEAHRSELVRLANRTGSIADLAREAAHRFSSRRSYFSEEGKLQNLFGGLFDGDPVENVMDMLSREHAPRQIIVPTSPDIGGWFAELSSRFDPELGAVTVDIEDEIESEHEIIIRDARGRVLHRRVTSRSTGRDSD